MKHKATARPCLPADIELKSAFLGPQAENAEWLADQFSHVLTRWTSWRRSLFPQDGVAISSENQQEPAFKARQGQMTAALDQLLGAFEKEIPKFSPRYVGHMFSELSLPALLGHFVALMHNPNNISAESSSVGVRIEHEAIEALAAMLGLPASASGHFTSGGTIANFEALTRARARSASWAAASAASGASAGARPRTLFEAAHCGWDLFAKASSEASAEDIHRFNVVTSNPFIAGQGLSTVFDTPYVGPVVLVPSNMHYSWKKGVELLGLGGDSLWPIALDAEGRLDIVDLRRMIDRAEAQQRPILCVVSVAGSTELGSIDPVDRIQDLLDNLEATRGLKIWHHVDAAYGGFLASLLNQPSAADYIATAELDGERERALRAIRRADSVTLDPHKLGYIPFACGACIVRDDRDYRLGSVDAPYIRYQGRDRGRYTLEGSRPATGAAATWMIAKGIGLEPGGYGRILARTIRSRLDLERELRRRGFLVTPGLDTNVLCFTVSPPNQSMTVANGQAAAIYAALSPEAHGPFIVSKTTISTRTHGAFFASVASAWGLKVDTNELLLIRMCLLNPFFDSKEMSASFTTELAETLGRLAQTGTSHEAT